MATDHDQPDFTAMTSFFCCDVEYCCDANLAVNRSREAKSFKRCSKISKSASKLMSVLIVHAVMIARLAATTLLMQQKQRC